VGANTHVGHGRDRGRTRRRARDGSLQRGLRAILALHVIFARNRIGLTADQQATWATITKNALLGD
jgi:protein-L-isoaspartate(D-aspartate) O-methyltransferase